MPLPLGGLEFPIESLEVFNAQRGHVLLLTPTIVEPNSTLQVVMDRVSADGRATITFVFERMERMTFSFGSGAELRKAILADFHGDFAFASDVYFEVTDGAVLGYSSNRDCLGVFSIRRDLVKSQELMSWDRTFVAHARNTGVGFGDAGRAYLRELVSTMVGPRAQHLAVQLERDGRLPRPSE